MKIFTLVFGKRIVNPAARPARFKVKRFTYLLNKLRCKNVVWRLATVICAFKWIQCFQSGACARRVVREGFIRMCGAGDTFLTI